MLPLTVSACGPVPQGELRSQPAAVSSAEGGARVASPTSSSVQPKLPDTQKESAFARMLDLMSRCEERISDGTSAAATVPSGCTTGYDPIFAKGQAGQKPTGPLAEICNSLVVLAPTTFPRQLLGASANVIDDIADTSGFSTGTGSIICNFGEALDTRPSTIEVAALFNQKRREIAEQREGSSVISSPIGSTQSLYTGTLNRDGIVVGFTSLNVLPEEETKAAMDDIFEAISAGWNGSYPIEILLPNG